MLFDADDPAIDRRSVLIAARSHTGSLPFTGTWAGAAVGRFVWLVAERGLGWTPRRSAAGVPDAVHTRAESVRLTARDPLWGTTPSTGRSAF